MEYKTPESEKNRERIESAMKAKMDLRRKRQQEWVTKKYGSLVGGTILDVFFRNVEGDPDGEQVPVLLVRNKAGKEVVVFALRDAEGNGPGFLEVV